MDTQIFIDMSRGPTRRLIVDGDLKLFRQLLDALDKEAATTTGNPTQATVTNPAPAGQPQGVQHDHP